MKFEFSIKENFEEFFELLEQKGQERGYELEKVSDTYYRLKDTVYNCYASIVILGGGRKVEMITSWSCFEYRFDFTTKKCTYKGAFAGFMRQNLLPQFTPLLTGVETVEARGYNAPLWLYVQQKQVQASVLSAWNNFEKYEDDKVVVYEPTESQIRRDYFLNFADENGDWLLPYYFKLFSIKSAPPACFYTIAEVEYCHSNIQKKVVSVNAQPCGDSKYKKTNQKTYYIR